MSGLVQAQWEPTSGRPSEAVDLARRIEQRVHGLAETLSCATIATRLPGGLPAATGYC